MQQMLRIQISFPSFPFILAFSFLMQWWSRLLQMSFAKTLMCFQTLNKQSISVYIINLEYHVIVWVRPF